MRPLAQNTLIQNRYLIVQLIGKGGMGDVYLAVDQRLGSAVALKRTFFASDEMLGGAFEREAKILARMRHPVLPRVSDHFGEDDEQYLVMEHISGDDLAKRLSAADRPFPTNWVLFWADQLLDALAYLHTHEPPVIHRDIKPQNLKLTDENHIVLLDFGLSKASTGLTNISSTGGGSLLGYTPHYAPMEQIRGIGTSARSDLYSLAATLYQLMTNAVPPDALTRAEALLNSKEDPLVPPHQLNPEVPVAVSNVIVRAMEVSQDKRYPTARDMQRSLRTAFSEVSQAMSANTVAFTAEEVQQNGPASSASPSVPVARDITEAADGSEFDNASGGLASVPGVEPGATIGAFTSGEQNVGAFHAGEDDDPGKTAIFPAPLASVPDAPEAYSTEDAAAITPDDRHDEPAAGAAAAYTPHFAEDESFHVSAEQRYDVASDDDEDNIPLLSGDDQPEFAPDEEALTDRDDEPMWDASRTQEHGQRTASAVRVNTVPVQHRGAPPSNKMYGVLAAAMGAIVLAILGFGGWFYLAGGGMPTPVATPTPSISTPTPLPSPSLPAAEPAASPGDGNSNVFVEATPEPTPPANRTPVPRSDAPADPRPDPRDTPSRNTPRNDPKPRPAPTPRKRPVPQPTVLPF